MNKKNPVEQEVEKIETQWEEFVATEKPILRWLISTKSSQLISTFIRVQENCDDSVADYFLPLYSPFENVRSFALHLAEEMLAQVENSKDAIEQETEQAFLWRAPQLPQSGSDMEALLLVASEIIKEFGKGFDFLVLVVRPSKIASAKGWKSWCNQLAVHAEDPRLWPKKLRVVLLDDAVYPVLGAVSENHPNALYSIEPPADINRAMTKVFDEADDGSPGARYRKHLVALHQAVEENKMSSVEHHAQQALQIAGQNSWYDLFVSALMVRAIAYLNNQRFDEAIRDYRDAQRYAQNGHEQGIDGCAKHWIFATLSEGSAWLTQKKWQDAALVYSQAAELSQKHNEAFFQMDSWRMSCFCYEQLKRPDLAWEVGANGIAAADDMKSEEREASTLPYLGDAMIRIAPSHDEKVSVEQKLTDYLGEDWREMLAAPEGESV